MYAVITGLSTHIYIIENLRCMNKTLRTSLFFLLISLLPVVAYAQKKSNKEIFLFGFGVNVKDSTVYVTNVQQVPGAVVFKKTKFLEHRAVYSREMQTFLTTQYDAPHTACTVFFSDSKEALEKKRNKVRREQQKNAVLKIREIPADAFRFVAPSLSENQ